MLKKIVLFPISLFVAFLALMAKWLLTLSSYVVAPLMLYIFGCGIYTAYRQTWNQIFISGGSVSGWPNCKEHFQPFAAFGRLFLLWG